MIGIFGEDAKATFRPKNGRPQPVEIIFNARHQEVDLDGKPYGEEKPVAWIQKDTKNCKPKYDDEFEIDGKLYIVRETKFDGLELDEIVLTEKIV